MVRISSLYGRTVTLISLVFLGSFAVLALAFSTISAHRSRDAINDLQRSILTASGSIREFVITRDPVHAKRAERILGEANDILHDRLKESEYERFHSELHLYLGSVSNLISTYQTRGFYEGDGLEGRMRAGLRQTEADLTKLNRRDLLSYLLQIRRDEKNYLLRQNEEYQDAVHAGVDFMTSAVETSALPVAMRSSIITALGSYQNDFDELVYLTQKGEWIHSEMTTIREYLDAELATLATAEDDRAQLYLWIGLAIILCSFVGGILYAHFMARAIVRPLERIRNAARSLAKGEIEADIDCTESGEVGELATAFSELADQVRMRVKAQKELRDSKAELEVYAYELEEAKEALETKANALSKLVSELEEAKNVAEHTIISKTLFLANMSHEIRTPLNGIIGMTSLLTADELRPDQYEIAQVIRSSGESLLGIVNSILDFAKIEHGGMDLEAVPFDVSTCIEDAMEMVSKQAADKHIEVSYDVTDDFPASLVGDRSRLRQILINLLANAVKFTETGEIHARGKLLERTATDAKLQIEVEDTGIGISLEAQAFLFDPFRQAEASTSRKFGGTGLGLSIAKHLAELMGGTMWLESTPGVGSRFFFTVRLALDPQRRRETVCSDFAAGKRTVLLGREPKFGCAVCSMVRQGGGTVNRFESIEEVQSVLHQSEPIDLILINDGDGGRQAIESARALRENAQHARIVLLVQMGQRAVDAAVSSYVTKPVKRAAVAELFADGTRRTPIYKLAPARSDAEDRKPSQNVKILLVEDNKMNQKVALKLLQRLGYSADVAENGIEAVDRVRKEGYDVVFMDMMMPGMDGLEATRKIRGDEALGRQPLIIAFTANASTEDRKACLDAGMDDYVSKPVSSETFANILERARREARTRHGARLENPSGPSVA